MTKLKTLKDIESPWQAEFKEAGINSKVAKEIVQKWLHDKFIQKRDLKQEAIKHVKQLLARKMPTGDIFEAEARGWKNGQIYWIKKFFNITQKDLK